MGSPTQTPLQGLAAGFAVDAAGGLTPVPGSPFAASRSVFAAAVHPQGRFIYTVELGQAISGFSIDATSGALTPISTSSTAGFPLYLKTATIRSTP